MLKLSSRGQVEPFYAMDILAAANKRRATGADVISMAVGQPAAPTPQKALEAARRALVDGHIGYTDSLGLRALQERIARYYAEHHQLDISPERIAVTNGSSAGFNLAFLSYFDAGDSVAITRPGYPAYRNIMQALGLKIVEIETPEGRSGVLTAEKMIEAFNITPFKAVLFASPANPTGASIHFDEMQKLVEAARERNIHLISDEIYHRLNYIGEDVTALSFGDDVTVINSFSKYYCMTGWRIGWMVVPQHAVRSLERISQSLYICAPEISQFAAIAAFDATDELETVKEGYRKNRALLAKALPEAGFKLLAPLDGAFYAYCDVSALCADSMVLAQQMLKNFGVAATPGRDFDWIDGHKSLRFSYAGAFADMEEAMKRLKNGFI